MVVISFFALLIPLGIVCYWLGRGARLNKSIKRGEAIVNLDTGEVFEPGSKGYKYAKAHGSVTFK